MTIGLVFAVTLLIALLVSERAHRTILSAAVLFLVAGIVSGPGMLGLIEVRPSDPLVSEMATLALFAVLFTDGMRVDVRELRSAWSLPGRALLLGMPFTAAAIAVAAHFIAGLPWLLAFLTAAVLSPTDPVFASAIVGREALPRSLRHLLNVESGINDGIALPFVVIFLAQAHHEPTNVGGLLTEIGAGVLVGIAVPWIAIAIRRSRFFAVHQSLEPLFLFAVGLLVLTIAEVEHINEYLAAFAAGITVASIAPEMKEEFRFLGELIARLLKLAALLLFALLLSPEIRSVGWSGVLFAMAVIFLARPLALALVLLRSELSWRERLTAAWFGPKGFASVVYGLLVLQRGIAGGGRVYHLIAVTIALSILLHSSTDVPIAHRFERMNEEMEQS